MQAYLADLMAPDRRLHIVCERYVGLFSLVQQVVSHVPWANAERRIPIAYFGRGCCYWRPDGYAGRDTVWEYYFEPLASGHGAAMIPAAFRQEIEERPPTFDEPWRALDASSIASANFGDHPALQGRTLQIAYGRLDPSARSRRAAARVISDLVKPRGYILAQADHAFRRELDGRFVIGVHARGTDALQDQNGVRNNSLALRGYMRAIDAALTRKRGARIFLATDEAYVVDIFKERYGELIFSNDFLRRKPDDPIAVKDAAGWTMPAYVARDSDSAARSGEEVVVDFLLLCKSHCLIHNGSSISRTVMLAKPELPSVNVHIKNTDFRTLASDYVRRLTTSSWC